MTELTDVERAEWRQDARADLPYSVEASRILALLDALEAVERERDEIRAKTLRAEAEWLDEAHRNSHDKGYTELERRGFALAAGWVRFHAERGQTGGPDHD